MEPGRLEDESVFSASRGTLPFPVSSGQQHLPEAHVHGAQGTLYQALQEEGASQAVFVRTFFDSNAFPDLIT